MLIFKKMNFNMKKSLKNTLLLIVILIAGISCSNKNEIENSKYRVVYAEGKLSFWHSDFIKPFLQERNDNKLKRVNGNGNEGKHRAQGKHVTEYDHVGKY